MTVEEIEAAFRAAKARHPDQILEQNNFGLIQGGDGRMHIKRSCCAIGLLLDGAPSSLASGNNYTIAAAQVLGCDWEKLVAFCRGFDGGVDTRNQPEFYELGKKLWEEWRPRLELREEKVDAE